jgi:DivIVA domain-containing protein
MMTANEIRSQRFGAQLRGLNSEEVLAFLGEVAEAYEDLQKMNVALAHAAREAQVIRPPEVVHGAEAQAESRSKTAEEKATPPSSLIELRAVALQEVEALLHDARAQAQALIEGAREREAAALADVEAARAQQRREAEDLVAEATSRAESLIVAAREEGTAIREATSRARAQAQALIDGAREREAAALADVEAARAQQRREAEAVVAEATSRAESLIAAAREQETAIREAASSAESLIVAAREQETAIRNEVERLSQKRLQIVDDVRATLDTYQEWVETVDPRGRVQGRRKALGTSNGGGEGALLLR